MLPLNNVGTVQWSRPIIQDHGLPMAVSDSLFFGTLLYVSWHWLSVVDVNNFGLNVNGSKDTNAEVLGHALGHQPGLVQCFSAHGTLLNFLDDLDDAIRLVLVLEEVVLPLLGSVTPVLFGKPLLNKTGLDNLLWSVLLHELAKEHERKLLRHVTKTILVEPLVAELLKWRTINQAIL